MYLSPKEFVRKSYPEAYCHIEFDYDEDYDGDIYSFYIVNQKPAYQVFGMSYDSEADAWRNAKEEIMREMVAKLES